MSVTREVLQSRLRRFLVALGLAAFLAWVGTFVLVRVDATPVLILVLSVVVGCAVVLQTLAPVTPWVHGLPFATDEEEGATVDSTGRRPVRAHEEPLSEPRYAEESRALIISWRTVVRGREEQWLEVFDETIGLLARFQQEGRIESFDLVLLEPSGGYLTVRGLVSQMAYLREDDDWRRALQDVERTLDAFQLSDGYVREGAARKMAMYRESIHHPRER
jgi:hypothetical protein